MVFSVIESSSVVGLNSKQVIPTCFLYSCAVASVLLKGVVTTTPVCNIINRNNTN